MKKTAVHSTVQDHSTHQTLTDSSKDGFSLAPPVLQTKLSIGQPNDRYEREADAIANQVMQKISTGNSPDIQTKCAACEQEELIQKKEGPSISSIYNVSAGSYASPELTANLNGSHGDGQPLPQNTRSEMEAAFGADFGGVRVHTDHQAVEMNRH